MKKKLIAAIIALASLPAIAEEDEPKPDPSIQGFRNQYCISAEDLARRITMLRDAGAPEDYPVQYLKDNGAPEFLWVAHQVYWMEYENRSPGEVAAIIRIKCDLISMDEKY